MSKYTTIQNIEEYLKKPIPDISKPQVNVWIDAVGKYIDRTTGRTFIASEPLVKKYDGKGWNSLFIDEAVEVKKVTVGETEIPIIDCLFYPSNEIPKTRILLTGHLFNKGNQNIEIKARWGYSTNCPSDITLAATIMVAGIINFSGEAQDNVKSEKLADYSVTYKDQVGWVELDGAKQIIRSYTKISI